MISPSHVHRPGPGGIDERAAGFLLDSPISETCIDPLSHPTRLSVNSGIPIEFENEYFVGRIVILHRAPDDYKGPYRYREFFASRKRRWELRWQGKFKKPVASPIVFGAEILSSRYPKHNIASRALFSLLLKFSISLARKRGADLFTNVVGDENEKASIKYFHFPIHSSDAILSTADGEIPPDIGIPTLLDPTETHTDCRNVFKSHEDIDISCTYTFVFYSMYADFVSWDICNVPIGLSGMSLNRLVGNQPISVVMRSKFGCPEEYFRILLGNKCTSPDWSTFLNVGERFSTEKMSEFFSIVSWNSNEDPSVFAGKKKPATRRRFRFMNKMRSALSTCFRAPISFVMRRSNTPPSVSTSEPRRRSSNPPIPDSRHVDFVTPISEESESKT